MISCRQSEREVGGRVDAGVLGHVKFCSRTEPWLRFESFEFDELSPAKMIGLQPAKGCVSDSNGGKSVKENLMEEGCT